MKKLVIFMLFAVLVNSVNAEPIDSQRSSPRDAYYSSGYFVGLNLGEGRSDVANIASFDTQNKGFVGHFYVGYNLNHYLAFQIGYLYLPSVKYTQAGVSDINIDTSGFDGVLKAKYPLGEGFSLYADAGGVIASTSQKQVGVAKLSQNATVFAYGGGLDYVFANVGGLHLLLDYFHADEKMTKALVVSAQDAISMGIYYQF